MAQIDFIEYTGRYPNLCSGRLFVRINGKLVSFGNYCLGEKGKTSDEGVENYPSFWHSGGGFDKDWCAYGAPWEISTFREGALPHEIEVLLPQLIDVFNENVPQGCCGGCA